MAETEYKRDPLLKLLDLSRKFGELTNKEEDIELSLGLSLNGRFGIDPKRIKDPALSRSSSVSEFVFSDVGGAPAAGLVRTCSLPAEMTEEQWRKRKEVQCLRRMEAKRKRLEKMKSVKTTRDQVVYDVANGEEGHVSNGSGSSGVSESDSIQLNHGANTPNESRSPVSVQCLPPRPNGQKLTVTIGQKTKMENNSSSTKATTTNDTNNHEAKETMKNMMVDMPCVSTRGIGPNGKRIEGFLYRYRKGEEVRIVCVCHGSFLSPAEFVKHAGGDDVVHPLKHIVVNPSPLL